MPVDEWEQLGSETALDNPYYRVRRDSFRLPSGRVVDDYLVGVLADYALVMALTPTGDVVLVRQWKQGVRHVRLELPGGMIDEGEQAAEAGIRELREETGFVATSFEHLGSLDVDASKAANQAHMFLARGAEQLHEPDQNEMESAEIVLVPLSGIPSLIDNGEIRGSSSVAALLLALRRLR